MAAITDLSKEQAYSMFGSSTSQQYIGRQFRVDHLTSEKGKTLNGKICRVVGFTSNYATNPDMRLQCKIIESDGSESKAMLLKGCNLVPTDSRIMWELMSASKPLSDKEIMKGLKQALSAHRLEPGMRRDLMYRLNLYRGVLNKLKQAGKKSKGNVLEEDEYCFPCMAAPAVEENEETVEYIMRLNRPACVGNNKLDLRFMDLGLKGDNVATCGICTETLSSSETKLVTLPCVHQFHASCLQEWLSSDLGRLNWNCPTCRHSVPHNMKTYMVNYETELRNRFQEFPLSGFCHKCILWFMEKDRNQALQCVANENGAMTMNQIGQKSEE
eukprot:CAMPEP_0113411466 /NCGR_PEP_ID=MMETSP0013_2-20120614/22280_1 /TAXON_ID=2843 ORGANISM="Skeletonema costatum, Strain 1716" /NCGR_SAMPLE_ID=MMETSP0013_2 /ASSEMBLY_ACC=CAM_ASM_000158 /LENGTH=327 /DNA_ID=CAMNT_0000297821 /DNA_START=99 /DNA_END=1079 /DNA_ORIENTATION=- /assembly_acc=CAM_ASM_000158